MINQKRKLRKGRTKVNLVTAIFFLIFITSFILFFTVSNIRLQARRGEVLRKIEAVTEEINELEEQKQIFQARIFQQEHRHILEREARTRFSLKGPGEQVVVILEPEQGLLPTEPLEKDKGLWQRLLEFFFHL